MDPLVIGVLVFAVFSSAVALLLVRTVRRARAEGLGGSALLGRLLPFLIGDALLAGLFVAWLLLR